MVEKNVSKAWLSVYLHEQSEKIIQKNKHLFKQQLNVSQSLYASGRSQQQDVLQAELELSLLDDQLQQVNSKIREARAVLSRWVGSEYSSLPLQMRPGLFGGSIQSGLKGLVDRLEEYPLITKYRAREKASRQQVELEKQKYSPQWGFDITYGKRSGENMDGSDRSDFVSAIVNFDLPVFTDRKQDRMLSAKKNSCWPPGMQNRMFIFRLFHSLNRYM